MKYIVLIGDGMADYPLDELGGKTPLEVAETPNMDLVAREGQMGTTKTIPEGLSPASDVANLSILGYDPLHYYKGRGPLEAANLGIELDDDEVAFRCNLVTVAEDKMIDYSSGHISSKEASILIEFMDEKLGSKKIRFFPGVSYRHLTIIKGSHPDSPQEERETPTLEELSRAECTPPHDITGQKFSKHLPKGKGADFLVNLMEKSRELLGAHEVNKVRIDLKENPGNMIWLWGQGESPTMPMFIDRFGVTGGMISAVDLMNGIATLIGLEVIKVPGVTGYYDTNFKGKAEYALDSLKNNDFVFVHVEAPDEAGHNADLRAKINAIENFDKLVVGTVIENRFKLGEHRILVMPDHATPISVRTHTRDPVGFAVCGAGVEPDKINAFTEAEAKKSGLVIEEAYDLLDYFIKTEALPAKKRE